MSMEEQARNIANDIVSIASLNSKKHGVSLRLMIKKIVREVETAAKEKANEIDPFTSYGKAPAVQQGDRRKKSMRAMGQSP